SVLSVRRQSRNEALEMQRVLAADLDESAATTAACFGADLSGKAGAVIRPQNHRSGVAVRAVRLDAGTAFHHESFGVGHRGVLSLESTADPDATAFGPAGVDVGGATHRDLRSFH